MTRPREDRQYPRGARPRKRINRRVQKQAGNSQQERTGGGLCALPKVDVEAPRDLPDSQTEERRTKKARGEAPPRERKGTRARARRSTQAGRGAHFYLFRFRLSCLSRGERGTSLTGTTWRGSPRSPRGNPGPRAPLSRPRPAPIARPTR